MKIVFYAQSQGVFDRFRSAVARLTPAAEIEPYETAEAFAQRLHRPSADPTIAVIVAADKNVLKNILPLKELLWGMRTILVLDDGDDEAIALGHTLRPRFISTHDGDFGNTAAVLSKMTEDCALKPSRV
jgi:hypothetical protein